MIDQNIRAEISKMSAKDKSRLIQCVFCKNDPSKCGADEQNENENGMCEKYLGNILFLPKSEM